MPSKHVVVVSRQFKTGAPITVDVTNEGVSIKVNLMEFLAQMAVEMGERNTFFKKAPTGDELATAAEAVIHKMKLETPAVMAQ